MKRQIKRLTALALALVMGLALMPLTAKPVQAASYPETGDIFIGGVSLAKSMPKGVSYDAATGVLELDEASFDGLGVYAAYTELTIRIVSESYIYTDSSHNCAIYAPDCRLTIDKQNSQYGNRLNIGTSAADAGSLSYVAGIRAQSVTLAGNVAVIINAWNDGSSSARSYGISTSESVVIKDQAEFEYTLDCEADHGSGNPDIGIDAGGSIHISDSGRLAFDSGYYNWQNGNSDFRLALKAGNDITVTDPSAGFFFYVDEDYLFTESFPWSPDGCVLTARRNYLTYGEKYYYQWEKAPRYISIAGDNRYATAAAIAEKAVGMNSEFVIVYGKNFPDALAANSYAGVVNAPILLADLDRLPEETKNYIIRNSGDVLNKITVIGKAFRQGFYDDLKALGFSESNGNLQIIGGNDRFETAEAVTEATLKLAAAKKIPVKACAVATGQKPFDALSFSPWAYHYHIPVLLVKNGQASESTKALIAKFDTVYLLGSPNVVSGDCLPDSVSSYRLAGSNRYETSQEIAYYFVEHASIGTYYGAAFTDGSQAHYVDALAGGQLQGHLGSPIILTNSGKDAEDYVKPWIKTYLATSDKKDNNYYFLGWAAEGKSNEYANLASWLKTS